MTHTVGFSDGEEESLPDSKTITIIDPTASENATLFFAPSGATITNIHALIQGTTDVTMQLLFGSSRASGSAVCASTTVSNSTTGVDIAITTAAIPASNYVWLVTTAITNTPTELSVTVSYL